MDQTTHLSKRAQHINEISDTCVIVSDASRERYASVFDSLDLALQGSGFHAKGFVQFPHAAVQKGNAYYQQNDEALFVDAFSKITKPIDINILYAYAKEGNPDFARWIAANMLTDQTRVQQKLWQAYTEQLSHAGVHINTLSWMIAGSVVKKYPESHLLYLLFDHQLTSPTIQAYGELAYHMVGRGFVGFGISGELGLSGSEGKRFAVINATPVKERNMQEQTDYAMEILHHEWTGHTLNGLKDHYDGRACVMTAKATALEYAYAGSKHQGKAYFCDACSKEMELQQKTSL